MAQLQLNSPMRILISFLLIASLTELMAQEIQRDSLQTEADTTAHFNLLGFPEEFGVFAEAMMEATPGPQTYYPAHQLGFGLTYKRLVVGGYIHSLKRSYESIFVFPNLFEVDYKYGGCYLGMHVFRSRPFEVDLRVNYGRGDMVWQQAESGNDFIRDEYSILKPELLVSYVPLKYVKVFITSGFRKMYNLSIPDLNNEEFSGFTLGLGIKAGFYQ